MNMQEQRTTLLQILINGASHHLAVNPYDAEKIGEGINKLLNKVLGEDHNKAVPKKADKAKEAQANGQKNLDLKVLTQEQQELVKLKKEYDDAIDRLNGQIRRLFAAGENTFWAVKRMKYLTTIASEMQSQIDKF